MSKSCYSSGNGLKAKALLREGPRSEGTQDPASLQQRIDQAVRLADRELGFGGPGAMASLHPVAGPEPRGTEMSAARGDFDKTFGVSGTPITSGFLVDLGECHPDLRADAAFGRAGAGDALGLQAADSFREMGNRSCGNLKSEISNCKDWQPWRRKSHPIEGERNSRVRQRKPL